jgi:hypothetical protein
VLSETKLNVKETWFSVHNLEDNIQMTIREIGWYVVEETPSG